MPFTTTQRLAQRLQGVIESALGKDRVVREDPVIGFGGFLLLYRPGRAVVLLQPGWSESREICRGEGSGHDFAFESFTVVCA